MKKQIYILSLSLFLMLFGKDVFAQLKSTGHIHNSGTIKIKGNAIIKQDTIEGKVVYNSDDKSVKQLVEQITYVDLEFKGKATKKLPQNKNLVILERFKTDSNQTVDIENRDAIIETKGVTTHNAIINPIVTYGKVKMNGQNPQDISGTGEFKELELDNTTGADVVDKGGFRVYKRLELTNGEFRNDADNNFTMGDGSEIVRYEGGSLQSSPNAENRYSVRYEGTGQMVTTGEIPNDEAVLEDLMVNNAGGIRLAKKATVNDSLHVGGKIFTDADTLVYNSQGQPTFAANNPSAEVIGSMKRTDIQPGRDYILNNPYTKVNYGTAEDLNGTKVIVSTIFPDSSYGGLAKNKFVDRTISFTGFDENGNEITGDVNVYYAYGWRHSGNKDIDETNNLPFDEIGLFRWVGDSWKAVKSSSPEENDSDWGYGHSDTLNSYGKLALGADLDYYVPLAIYAWLEGAFVRDDGTKFAHMHTKLNDKGLLDKLPDANSYPVSLIENYNPDSQTVVPDSVVDYIVVEFRPERNADGFFKLGFIKSNGQIVDLAGNDMFVVGESDNIDFSEEYFVALRHRNHAPVISNKQYSFDRGSKYPILSFNRPEFVEGGANAIKLVDIYDRDGQEIRYYALKAGFNPDAEALEDLINITKNFTLSSDHEAAYNLFVNEGYLYPDYDMNGIVTTRDFNYSWNNRLFK